MNKYVWIDSGRVKRGEPGVVLLVGDGAPRYVDAVSGTFEIGAVPKGSAVTPGIHAVAHTTGRVLVRTRPNGPWEGVE